MFRVESRLASPVLPSAKKNDEKNTRVSSEKTSGTGCPELVFSTCNPLGELRHSLNIQEAPPSMRLALIGEGLADDDASDEMGFSRKPANTVSSVSDVRVMAGLINGLNSDHPGMVGGAVAALCNLSNAKDNKVSLANNEGVIAGLVRGMHSDTPEIAGVSVWAIAHLASSNETGSSYDTPFSLSLNSGVLSGLIKGLDSDHPETVGYAVKAIAHFSASLENRWYLAHNEGVNVGLIRGLNADCPETVGFAARAICRFSFLGNSSWAQHEDLLVGLGKGLRFDRSETVAAILRTLDRLACEKENKVPLAQHDGLMAGLVHLLSADCPKTVKITASVIARLAVSEENQLSMIDTPGLLLGLTAVRRAGCSGARSFAASALSDLTVPTKLNKALIEFLDRVLKRPKSVHSQRFVQLLMDISSKTAMSRGPKFLGKIPGLFNAVSALENLEIKDTLMNRIVWTDRSWDHSDPTATREMADAFHTHFLSKQPEVRAFEASRDSTSSQGLGDALVDKSLPGSYSAYLELTNARPLSGVTYSPFLGG